MALLTSGFPLANPAGGSWGVSLRPGIRPTFSGAPGPLPPPLPPLTGPRSCQSHRAGFYFFSISLCCAVGKVSKQWAFLSWGFMES